MSERKDGGPAFPQHNRFLSDSPNQTASEVQALLELQGMSLRDWFAGMALQGYFSEQRGPAEEHRPATMAAIAYRYADAMLQERDK